STTTRCLHRRRLEPPECGSQRPEQASAMSGDFMPTSLILQGKRAVVFGAGGSIGAAVAKEFATEGAEVFLAGRTPASLEAVADEITSAGGQAHVAVIDALDGAAVDGYLEAVVRQGGGLDIEFNAMGPRIHE